MKANRSSATPQHPATNMPKPSSAPSSRFGLLKTLLLSLVAVLLATFGLSQFTPKPFVLAFRALTNGSNSVKLGTYAAAATAVTAHAPIKIPVAGAPAAGLLLYTPRKPSAVPRPLVLLIHGGGWIIGEAKQLDSFARLLASEGFVVASLDYSLAPEYQYPTPIRQAAAAIAYLQKHAARYGADPAAFFLAGNSAGAQLSSQLGAMLTNPAFTQEVGVPISLPAGHVKGIILYSGPYNFDTVGKDNFPGFRMYAWSYTGQKDYESYARLDELSTVQHITAAFPATYLTTGDADPLAPQTAELDSVLRANGVAVTSRFWTGSQQGLPHDYIYDLTTKAAQTAFQDVVTFIRKQAGTPLK